MSFKKWMGCLVAGGIIVALGIELWTVGRMIWTGFVGKNQAHEQSTNKQGVPNRFRLAGVEARFEILALFTTTPSWRFHAIVRLNNPTIAPRRIVFQTLELKSGSLKVLDRRVQLEPGQERTVQWQRNVPPGVSPYRLRVSVHSGGDELTKWITLPKVPVRAP